VDTSLEISKEELASTISWGWMAAISGVILIFLVLFLIKIIRNCKDSRETS
jgi:succinate dehydrogenase hydrophobic anchor subunit